MIKFLAAIVAAIAFGNALAAIDFAPETGSALDRANVIESTVAAR